ncbi:hypothetical protein E2C01_031502 [Portunus trituberculatus]|uniref:Uncharacterized protein n=1 Tax=Portunus trituberculatus TaxID=210409 RepID=A0A5B7EX09_PORTR|nr:hypothetical protein [Portunus trituberculatus]
MAQLTPMAGRRSEGGGALEFVSLPPPSSSSSFVHHLQLFISTTPNHYSSLHPPSHSHSFRAYLFSKVMQGEMLNVIPATLRNSPSTPSLLLFLPHTVPKVTMIDQGRWEDDPLRS